MTDNQHPTLNGSESIGCTRAGEGGATAFGHLGDAIRTIYQTPKKLSTRQDLGTFSS